MHRLHGPAIPALLIAGILLLLPPHSHAADCLWIASYAPGYEWNDGIERGLRSTLGSKCKLDTFFMDTRGNKSPAHARQQALAAKQLIEQRRPDVVIASDDNASKYLVLPYFKNSDIPIVVNGINWSVDEYGYPFNNVTGMVEISPIRPLLRLVAKQLGHHKSRALYLAPNTHTSRKSYKYYRKHLAHEGITLEALHTNTFSEWKQGFLAGQEYDLLLLSNNSGIENWDNNEAADFALTNSATLSISLNRWMTPYSMIVFTKVAEEQGEWAAKVALEILNGTKPGDIPMTANQRWDEYLNIKLLDAAGIQLTEESAGRTIVIK